ncbi:MAG: glycosyltransferase family 4 protein [Geminicoccaceae bacterium]
MSRRLHERSGLAPIRRLCQDGRNQRPLPASQGEMTRKRIGVPFTGERVGGSHVSTCLLLQGLDPSVYEPLILVHGEGPVADYLRKRSIPFVIEPLKAIESWQGGAFSRLLASLRSSLLVRHLIRKHQLDLVHVQDHKAFQLWVWGTRLAGRPMILHWRGPYRKTVVTRAMMRFAEHILVISRYLQEKLPGEIRRRSELIYNPFDTAELMTNRADLRLALRKELGLAEDSTVLAWIGSLDHRKQPDQFVDIVKHMNAERPFSPVTGIVCGSPGDVSEDLTWIEMLASAGRTIRMLGFRDPITPTLAACDALVVTAADEPFGRTVIEAMLAGVPVVAAADGGYVEALENGRTGSLVPPSDRQAFVRAIQSLLDDPKANGEIVVAARRAARDRFSIERHVQAVEKIYRSALGMPAGIDAQRLSAE